MYKKVGFSFLLIINLWTFAMEHTITKNNIKIWYETFGDSGNPPLLLIMGGGCQGIMWPKEFCEKLAQTFFVIRYDNRDVGLSSRIYFDNNPYDLQDMAYDALYVLDDCNIKKAYIFSISMGG